MKWFALALIAVALVGCRSGEVTEADADKMKKEFSQENYEKAMREAGRGDELESEKQRNAQHMGGQQEGQ